jgi:hypothetical protein
VLREDFAERRCETLANPNLKETPDSERRSLNPEAE